MESQIFSKHCYVPGIVVGTEDATRNRAKSLPQWSQNSREQVSTLHGFLPFCGAMILGQVSALFLILHPVHPPQRKDKGALSTPTHLPAKPWHPESLPAQPRTKAGGTTSPGHHVPLPRVWRLRTLAWPRPDPGELSLGKWFRGVSPRTPTKDGK